MKIPYVNIDLDKDRIRIFYTSDIHGSSVCFKKLLNAGKFYKADIVIVGGDLCGKLLIPIVYYDEDNIYQASFQGRVLRIKTLNELEQLKEKIRMTGAYYVVLNKKELDRYSNEQAKHQLFLEIIQQSIKEWILLAEEKLKNSNIIYLVMPGNDDPLEIDTLLEQTNVFINPESKIIDINGIYQIASTGYSNETPWKCPRDIREEELYDKIEAIISNITRFETAIFNFHTPPYNSTLDLAPKLDENLRVVLEMGQPIYVPVGSMAVRKLIEKYQPLLGLHGHIHESRNAAYIGKTLCINPGSEYSEGILHGVIVDLYKKRVERYFFTTG